VIDGVVAAIAGVTRGNGTTGATIKVGVAGATGEEVDVTIGRLGSLACGAFGWEGT